MSEKLKPCPFCGSPAWMQTGRHGEKFVECQSQICKAALGPDCRKATPKEAAEAWNTRSREKQPNRNSRKTELIAEIQRLREEVRALQGDA